MQSEYVHEEFQRQSLIQNTNDRELHTEAHWIINRKIHKSPVHMSILLFFKNSIRTVSGILLFVKQTNYEFMCATEWMCYVNKCLIRVIWSKIQI